METLPRTLPLDEAPADTNVLRDAMLVVLRRRWTIAGVYAGVLVGAIACIFLLTPQYRASAKVLLTTNRADISTSPDKTTELVRNDLNDNEINSQLEILRSNDLIEDVLKRMSMPVEEPAQPTGVAGAIRGILGAPKAAVRAAYRRMHNLPDMEPSSPLYWAVRSVLEDLDAGSLRGSNVMEIGFTSPDPRWARDFVNALTTAYVDRQSHMQTATQAESFFTEQSELLRKKLNDSEAALHDLREKAGVLAGQQTEVHQRLNEFNAELAHTKIARAEMEQKVAYLEGVQARAKKSGAVASPQLLDLEAKRAELIGRYRDGSERVRDIDRQIQALKSRMATYDSISAADAPRTSADMDITALHASLAALKAKEDALSKETAEYRRQAEMLDSQNFDLVRLDRQQKLDEEAYLSYVRSAEEFRLSNALEQSKILRLTVVELASLPMDPVSPRRGRILVFAILGGLVVSLGAAFARELFDTTIKTPSDVRRHAQLDVLAMLPERH